MLAALIRIDKIKVMVVQQFSLHKNELRAELIDIRDYSKVPNRVQDVDIVTISC